MDPRNLSFDNRIKAVESTAVVAARSRSVWLQAGGAQLHLFVSDRPFDALQNLEAQFGQTDGDNNEYADRDEAQRNFFLSRVFSAADADRDDKLYIAELESYLDRQRDMMRARRTASVRDIGGTLFMAWTPTATINWVWQSKRPRQAA